jgi:hypothetical protein
MPQWVRARNRSRSPYAASDGISEMRTDEQCVRFSTPPQHIKSEKLELDHD